ncbi:uncharacterized protein EV420DRAFT_1483999 [Desarmillaria tabescens]|uniref:NAD(P)-binding protein n=1 Tax=Armillaria tabescens TaxID=1929756 RepID=A0AA39JPW9_ARMTA|nr:uncharacterized protein EV420DRAFT_1483999 [Desarmillaria tabescens]KAK0446564.1 hypothetical protein EV420DRAFT_1483999 [Desarmillaria tabescens]
MKACNRLDYFTNIERRLLTKTIEKLRTHSGVDRERRTPTSPMSGMTVYNGSQYGYDNVTLWTLSFDYWRRKWNISFLVFNFDALKKEDSASRKYTSPAEGWTFWRKPPCLSQGVLGSIIQTDPFEPETVQNWADMFVLNTITPFIVVQAFQSLLIKGAHSRPQGTSSVSSISSIAANIQSSPGGLSMAYAPTKAALNHLTRIGTSFATRDIPICVNAISPRPFASQLMSLEFFESLKTSVMLELVAQISAKRHER